MILPTSITHLLSVSHKYKKYIVTVTIVTLAVMSLLLFWNNKCLREKNHTFKNNELAIIAENDSLKNQSIVYELSIQQLNYLNDSISLKMKETLEELRIQKKKVSQIQYIETVTEVHDSLIFTDTIFVKDFHKDTVITDNQWYQVGIALDYPGTIEVNPSFRDEYYIIQNQTKTTVNPPKKTKIGRFFQRKQKVMVTTVHNKNPYNNVQETRTVKIIK